MKVPGNTVKLGDITLRPENVNVDTIKTLADKAAGSGVAEAKEAKAAIDNWAKTGEISTEDYAKVEDFRKAAGRQFRDLKSEFWDRKNGGANWEDLKPVEAKMGKVGAFLHLNEKIRTELREATALTAVQAAAGASFSGPVGVVALYAAYSNGATWDGSADKATKELLETYQGYLSGDSRMITEGNLVEQFHRDSLWHSMNGGLKEGIADAKAGESVELTEQYYELTSAEILGKNAEAVDAKAKFRGNIDPGRLSYPDKDDKGSYFDVDDIPHKMRTVIQLLSKKGADVGLTIFAVNKLLNNNPENLMHRKVLRKNDEVTLSGMNANDGSGENVDAGYRFRGPVARKIMENLKRDVANSVGAGIEEIWGEKHFQGFTDGRLKVGVRGMTAILDVLGGPAPADQELDKPTNMKELEALAKKAKVKLAELIEAPDGGEEKALEAMLHGAKVELSATGKEKLISIINQAVTMTQAPDNIERAQDISLPSGEKVGTTRVDLADLPTERETLMLDAIAKAEKFIYLPGFVVTRAVAAAIVARKNELAAQGKELDVKVIADPGVYPGGDTPNSWGVKFLEDHGINARWAMLTRSGWHDRKIHAKQLITDKGEMTGSTNFSNKGMKDNWETSTFVHFDPEDPKSMADRDRSVAQFMELWQNNSFELSTLDLAGCWNRYKPAEGKEYMVEDSRNGAVKKIIGWLEDYEKETAGFMARLAKRPDIAPVVASMVADGYSEGDAILNGVVSVIGERHYYEGLAQLPAYKTLMEEKGKVEAWKAREARFNKG